MEMPGPTRSLSGEVGMLRRILTLCAALAVAGTTLVSPVQAQDKGKMAPADHGKMAAKPHGKMAAKAHGKMAAKAHGKMAAKGGKMAADHKAEKPGK